MLCADNEEAVDAEVSAVAEPATDDHAMNERATSKNTDSAGPPARPQPPVCWTWRQPL